MSIPARRVRAGWFVSSYSNAGGSCVETSISTDVTLVRDSKDRRPDSPIIEFTPKAWKSFLNVVTREDS
ncbi:DUF397 domain-containing protein [Amycolatopsis vastitatis]|uniref:DUF397 domain-containing protein n=1 Tax=Amycolatopsis vastitatis TaxID=1905142 RepID=A0A229T0X6_9PSEU|nr:DUF397 domain-containing protein [Amycolatopsis vastitatis]